VKYWLLLFFVFYFFYSSCQTIFYHDICKCGVTGAGFSTGQGSGNGSFNIYIEPGSTIKKAWLLYASEGYPDDISLIVNGISYNTSSFDYKQQFPLNYWFCTPTSVYIKDVTSDINPVITNYSVTIPYQNNSPNTCYVYSVMYLYVIYEKSVMPSLNYLIILNDQELKGNEFYNISSINPINTINPVGFSLFTDRTGANFAPDEKVYFNSNLLGQIGGSDAVNNTWNFAGVKGHFYYQNNQLFGLDDDTPDAIMNTTDGLADVSSYLTNNSTSCSFQLTNISFPNQPGYNTNLNLAYFLTYTTPCDTFSVNLLTEDTTVCKGASVQLGVSGGNTSLSKPAYEWLPQKDLSCYNCANPVFTGDSSQVYTVRIWNTDSCSKVLPVRVKVLPLPKFTSIVTTPTNCGDNTGVIVANNNGSIDSLFSNGVYIGIASQTLSNLNSGNYTLYLIDTNSCKSKDTTVTINSVNLTNALFTLNPTTGAVPLAVSSDNQSTHATNYMWYFQNDSSNSFSPSFEFDTSGTYTVTLVAYNNTPNCSDTFSLQIIVYDSLQLIIPNVFTPNGDNQNDVFSIQVSAPCTGTIFITNRWGNELFSKNIATEGKEKITLWDSMTANGKASDGVYFYLLKLQDKQGKGYSFQGFVEVFH